jgi:mannitol/fructose-specific phosphotransferase system IIA component (Ntr-type)
VGIDFKAPDSSSVTLLFVLLAPARGQSAYVETLARASRLLKSARFRQSLLKARGADEIRRVFAAEDTG